MKEALPICLSFFLVLLPGCADASSDDADDPSDGGAVTDASQPSDAGAGDAAGTASAAAPHLVRIHVNEAVFSAKLYDTPTTRALLALMPLTLDMRELNGNEKYFYLSMNLPVEPERVGEIRTGDLMLYGTNCLVLFYENFPTSYSYTRLGYIEDASGLAAALGGGGIRVSFERFFSE